MVISSPNRTEIVSIAPYASKSIEKLLKNKNEYKIVHNPGKRVKTACWTTFGFPARIISEKEFEIIPGFASCKDCFGTFRHVDGSTTSLNEHQCPRIAAKGEQSIEECLNTGRELRLDQPVMTNEVLCCDRTIRWSKKNVGN